MFRFGLAHFIKAGAVMSFNEFIDELEHVRLGKFMSKALVHVYISCRNKILVFRVCAAKP